MPNQSGKVVLVLVLFILLASVGGYLYFSSVNKDIKTEQTVEETRSTEVTNAEQSDQSYTSGDLKISFKYPNSWVIDDRYFEILIASFDTNLNTNKIPDANEVEIIIHNARGCHETIDENLEDPSCGEADGRNVIISKETEDLNGMMFYKYLVKYPSEKEQEFYFLEKGDRILQIDKNPDPFMFEEEFNNIVKSIKFE